jgi:hypothetical protein
VASADLVIRKGDTKPVLSYTCTDSAGAAVNITGATVTFVMRAITATGPAVNAAATIVSGPAGTVSYTFTANDTAVAGPYAGEFHVTFGDGTKQTFPGDGYLEILVEEDLVTPGGARLVTLYEVRDHLRLQTTDRSRDARLVQMIDAVAPVVENISGPVLQRIYQNETYDGGNGFISLRHRPVLEVHSVVEFRGSIRYELTQVPTPDLGTTYSYMFEPPGRIVRRTVGGGMTSFPPGADQVFVTYTAGRATVPPNIREGTLELIRVNFQQTEQGGRPQLGAAGGMSMDEIGGGAQMLGFFVPNRVKELLAPSGRHPSVA